ncbi:FG-GAP repeat domain-containing protein [Streptomyces sp. NEAU-S77]|uniref:FG-GAP repeat domain-containing protein n=1 Tax=Streptomyces sp. NEAU-S77 TaxID=3411033 RepID=UPI003BA35FAB
MTPAPPRTPTRPLGRAALTTFGVWAGVLALLTGCGAGGSGDGPRDARGSHASAASAGAASGGGAARGAGSTATTPVPRGKGSKLPDDVNGDRYPDLQLPVPPRKRGLPSRIAFVHGSHNGLHPAARTVLRRADLGLPADDVAVAGATEVATADLDGDGYADVTTTGGERLGAAEAKRTHATVRTAPYIAWGSAGGPPHARSAARVQLTGPTDSVDPQRPTVGDFNGDGHHDLAVVRANRRSFLVLYGPFSRAGRPATTVPYRSPFRGGHAEIGDLVADRIRGDRPTDLVVHGLSAAAQSGSTLLTAGPQGLRHTGRTLRKGNSITFGDFNGDARRDVAVGASGTRADEGGDATEKPDIGRTVSVYYGTATGRYVRSSPSLPVPGMSGMMMAADTDGDGADELAVPLGSGGARLLTPRPGRLATARHTLARTVPARVDGKAVREDERAARLYGAADFDHDGKDEIVLAWGPGIAFSLYGERPERWWITNGTSDKITFSSRPFAAGR